MIASVPTTEIHPEICYALPLDALGFGKAALREMRRNGLPVRRVGRRHFVLGKDLISHIESRGQIVT